IRDDIYSVGCVLQHMLVGQPPFPDKNLFNQIVRHATETPRPVRDFNPAIAEGLEQILSWLMAKQPEHRYATPTRAAQALAVFLLVGSEAAPAEEPPKMREYLTWLETEEVAPAADGPAPPTPVMAPVPTAAAPARRPAAAPVIVAAPVRAGPKTPVPAPRAEGIRRAQPV